MPLSLLATRAQLPADAELVTICVHAFAHYDTFVPWPMATDPFSRPPAPM